MRLTLATWSFPALTLAECAGLTQALGIGALDVGLAGRAALDRDEILSDPLAAAGHLRGLSVDLTNYYHLFGDGLAGRNLALPGTTAANARDLEKVLTFADAAGIPSVFVLPGIVNPGQDRAAAARIATDSFRALAEVASGFDAVLCTEPHVQSWMESPTLARALAEETGVRLCLDYAHFACLGYRQEEIDPLVPLAAHVHLRQARPGALQAKFAQGTLNFPAMFGTLRAAGYTGAMTLEAVHQDYMNTLGDDVLTEVIALRDSFLDWKGVT